MRTLTELEAVFRDSVARRNEAWAATDLNREAEYSAIIERVLTEATEHPDFVKVPC